MLKFKKKKFYFSLSNKFKNDLKLQFQNKNIIKLNLIKNQFYLNCPYKADLINKDF